MHDARGCDDLMGGVAVKIQRFNRTARCRDSMAKGQYASMFEPTRGDPKSSSMRPNSESLAIFPKNDCGNTRWRATPAPDALNRRLTHKLEPAYQAFHSTLVLRVSPLILILTFEAADQICIVAVNGHKLRNRLAVFGNQNAVRPTRSRSARHCALNLAGGTVFTIGI